MIEKYEIKCLNDIYLDNRFFVKLIDRYNFENEKSKGNFLNYVSEAMYTDDIYLPT